MRFALSSSKIQSPLHAYNLEQTLNLGFVSRDMLAGVMIPTRYFNGGSEEYGSPSRLMDCQNHQNHQNEAPHIFRNEEFDTRSVSENLDQMASGDEHDDNPSLKKKRYHRHTQEQILELETFFKQCPHPDDRQRKELGHTLGLEPLQIKFWFQNKRTQVKAKDERTCNQVLRAENDRLRAENIRYKEALSNSSCRNCGGPAALGEMSFDENQLKAENLKLGREIDRIMGIAAKYGGKSVMSHPLINVSTLSRSPGDLGSGMGELMKTLSGSSNVEKPLIMEVAVSAMEELLTVALAGEPLWFSGFNIAGDILNQEEYAHNFLRGEASKNMGWSTTEASRETAVVMMSPMSLVEILMDVSEWTAMFPSIVIRAVTMEVLSTGVAGNYNGALQVMLADYQVPSPFVPTRGSLFVRYCKQHQDGTWAVVDASLDSAQSNSTKCRRRPSGCLIQEMSNGHSKVTWVEHVEVDDRSVPSLYKMVIKSGLAFGAKRWVATLKWQCERLASAMDHNFPVDDIAVISPEGRKNLLKLAERMVISFCSGVSGSDANNWSHVSDANKENIRISMKKCVDDPGRPFGHVITAATSLWLPVNTWRLFNFLRDETNRTEWDILSNSSIIKEVFHIANGPERGNCVSLLGVDNKNDILILQESSFNMTGSYVIYAPVDCHAMDLIFHGGDSEYVALLPSGFAVLPDGPCEVQGGVIGEPGSGGSLLTIAFQILVDSPENSELALRSVATVNNLISCTIDKIKAAVLGEVFNESSLA